jgi:hypothetical protein
MIDPKFPTKEELRKMSLPELQSLRVLYPEEEQLIQEEVKYRLSTDKRAIKVDIKTNDIYGAHIATPEQEKEMQIELNRRKKEALKQMNLSEEDLQVELDKIEPKHNIINEPIKSKIKCELCGSKGWRHKKGCPTLQTKTV